MIGEYINNDVTDNQETILSNQSDIEGKQDTTIANIGVKTGYVAVPYVFGNNTILDHLNTAYYHIHGQAFVYPDHADNVLLTAGAGAWDLTGAKTEVIPAGELNTSAFDLHWIQISELSGNSDFQIDIYSGEAESEVLIASARTNRNTNFSREGPQPIQIPQQPAGTRISCRLSNSTAGAETCTVSFSGHYYA